MGITNRKFSSDKYRYGFNGKEKDNSTGEGNLDFGARIYDSRLGRWLGVDAYADKYPNVSPYAFCINSPLQFKDVNGNWLEDKYGRVITTDGGYNYERNGSEWVKVLIRYLYMNDGQRVEFRIYDSRTPVSNLEFEKGNTIDFKRVIDKDKIEDISNISPESYNCHGNTLNGNPYPEMGRQRTLYGANIYIPGNDDDNKDNVSKIYKSKAEFTPVNSKDVQPGDVAIFNDGKGDIAHSATVTKAGKNGRHVKLDSKDDRKAIQRDVTIKKIMKGNKTDFKKFVGYFRHNGNKRTNVDGSVPLYDDNETVKKAVEQAKQETKKEEKKE